MSFVQRVRSGTARRACYLALAALITAPCLAAADEVFSVKDTVAIPGNALVSFDISWVDPFIHSYFLADRSNKSIDVINTNTKSVTQYQPGFVGFTGNNDTSGPNGVQTIYKGDGRVEVWAGDGEQADPSCASATPVCSTVKVLEYPSGTLIHTIATNGLRRADELCYDQTNHVVQIANDAEADVSGHAPFVSFISTDSYKVLGTLTFPEATNGIEQCQWSERTGLIYLNIPEVNGPGNDSVDGNVYVIDPKEMKVVRKFDIPVSQCAGPQGMALGPDDQILLGCNAASQPPGTGQNAAVIDSHNGKITALLTGLGGDDEVWFNPGDGHYFLAGGSYLPNEQLGVVDSARDAADETIFVGTANGTTRRAHSVAADETTNEVYLPVPQTGGGTPGFTSTICGTLAAQGCVAVFRAKHDDRPVFVRRF
jgi:hypothetical protein